jgi:hypothetical protein
MAMSVEGRDRKRHRVNNLLGRALLALQLLERDSALSEQQRLLLMTALGATEELATALRELEASSPATRPLAAYG